MRVLLLVIAMLLQSLAPVGATRVVAAPAVGGACGCATVCCCGAGSGPDAMADVCMCKADPVLPQRTPEAPLPGNGKKVTPFLALSLSGVVAQLPDLARHAWRPAAEPAPTASHNKVQALLCVWRT